MVIMPWLNQRHKMMKLQLDNLIDLYDLKARVSPALLVLFPTICTMWLWFPKVHTWLDALSGSVFVYLLAWFLGRIARDRGVAVQNKIFSDAGGNLTALMLRNSDKTLNPLDKERYRKLLEETIGQFKFPSSDEDESTTDAMNKYDMAVNWLRRHTRDTSQFGLLFKENMTYGFHRNLYGMKLFGIGFSMLNLITMVGFYCMVGPESIKGYYPALITSFLIHLITLIVWFFFITEKAVLSASRAYAERLLETTEIVCREQAKK